MSALLSRVRSIAMTNAADAMITMTVTGSVFATLATLTGGRLLGLTRHLDGGSRPANVCTSS